MKKLVLFFVSFIVLTVTAIEINYISFTNNVGEVTKIAIFGKLNSVKVSYGTNSIPYTVTTTNTVKTISK